MLVFLFTLLTLGCPIMALVSFFVTIFGYYHKLMWAFAFLGFALASNFVFTNQYIHDTMAASMKASEEARYEHDKPRLLYTTGDCEVYRFYSGYTEHFFTKCPHSKTTTDTTILERHGKSTVEIHEPITTDNP